MAAHLALCSEKILSISFLLKLMLSWTFHVAVRGRRQSRLRGRSQHLAGGVGRNLGAGSVQFVTSQEADLRDYVFRKCILSSK